MSYKVTKTVPSIVDLISECTPCSRYNNECIGPACKLYQVSKFLDMSCAYLFYDQTDKVIKFFKGDIDIEVVEDSQAPEDSQTPEESNIVNINLSSSSINKNGSFTSVEKDYSAFNCLTEYEKTVVDRLREEGLSEAEIKRCLAEL